MFETDMFETEMGPKYLRHRPEESSRRCRVCEEEQGRPDERCLDQGRHWFFRMSVRRMRHVRSPLHGFETVPLIHDGAKPTRFPIRYLRYWFGRLVLTELLARSKRPLRVLEVGIDRGQQLAFMGGGRIGDGKFALPAAIERWDGFDVQIDPDVLRRYSYTDHFQVDVEGPFDLGERRYDAVVLLHVLEHLRDPERAVRRLRRWIAPGGVIMGGSPTMPDALAGLWQRWLRRKNADKMHDVRLHKHLSVMTPNRIRGFANVEGMAIDLLTGAYFLRWTGSTAENSALWLRANLLWGCLFPALAGEVYFALRLPAAGECPSLQRESREFVEQVTTDYNSLEPVESASLAPDDKGHHAAEEV
jgi:SAM-dependent methyltransferase